jgi:hypothetical protein
VNNRLSGKTKPSKKKPKKKPKKKEKKQKGSLKGGQSIELTEDQFNSEVLNSSD